MEAAESRFAETREADRAKAARDMAVGTLQSMISGNPGDTLEAAQFRGKIQDMVRSIHGGADKPPAEFVSEAMRPQRGPRAAGSPRPRARPRVKLSGRSTPTTGADTRPSPAPTWARCSTSRSGSEKALDGEKAHRFA